MTEPLGTERLQLERGGGRRVERRRLAMERKLQHVGVGNERQMKRV